MRNDSLSTANYVAVINDLRCKRDEIDRLIHSLEAFIAEPSAPPPTKNYMPISSPESVIRDANEMRLATMNIGEACVWVLEHSDSPLTIREIAGKLTSAGFKINSADPIKNVSAALYHRKNTKKDVTKVGKGWQMVRGAEKAQPHAPLNGMAAEPVA